MHFLASSVAESLSVHFIFINFLIKKKIYCSVMFCTFLSFHISGYSIKLSQYVKLIIGF